MNSLFNAWWEYSPVITVCGCIAIYAFIGVVLSALYVKITDDEDEEAVIGIILMWPIVSVFGVLAGAAYGLVKLSRFLGGK